MSIPTQPQGGQSQQRQKAQQKSSQGGQSPISWEAERLTAPSRPALASSVPEEELIERPRRIAVAVTLVCLALVAVGAFIALALMRLDEVRAGILEALPSDLADDYEEADLERAATVLLAAIAVVLVVVLLSQLFAIRALSVRRSRPARATYIVLTVISFAVIALAVIVRDGDTGDLALGTSAALAVILAAALITTPRVTRWLRQSEERRTIPLTRPELDD